MVNTKMIDYILCKDGEAVYSHQKQDWLEADYGSDHELLIAKFRLKFEESRENH